MVEAEGGLLWNGVVGGRNVIEGLHVILNVYNDKG